MHRVLNEPNATRLWTRMLVTYAGMMARITAANAIDDAVATPGYEVYEPGDIIIRQGERADYVFNMSSGTAEVLVDDITVGRIGDGEIFGAMAALTHADRSATVRAKTSCSVVKVPKEQFTQLIKSNPATIHSLLVDMANSIVNLNEQLVGLRGNQNAG
jgi:CRP-like cAMP-binding protein